MPNLFTHPIHLGLGAKAIQQPEFTGMDFYASYIERTAGDGIEGRLVHGRRNDAPSRGVRRCYNKREAWPGRLCDQRARRVAHSRCGGQCDRIVHHRWLWHRAPAEMIKGRYAIDNSFLFTYCST